MSNDMRLIMKNWKKTLNESKEPAKKIMENDGVNASTDLFTLDISTLKNEDLQEALEYLEEEFHSLSVELEQAKRFNDQETAAEARLDKKVIRDKILAVTRRIEAQAKIANATETPKDDEAIEKVATDAAEKVNDLPQIGDTQPTNQEIDDMFDAVMATLDQGEEIVKKSGEEEQSGGEQQDSEEQGGDGFLDKLKTHLGELGDKIDSEEDRDAMMKAIINGVEDPDNQGMASDVAGYGAALASLFGQTYASVALNAGSYAAKITQINGLLGEGRKEEAKEAFTELVISASIDVIPWGAALKKVPGANDGLAALSKKAMKNPVVKEAVEKVFKTVGKELTMDILKGTVKTVGKVVANAVLNPFNNDESSEEQPQERKTVKLNNNTPKLQQLANAFVNLSDEQYGQLRQVLSDELETAKLEQIPWEKLPQGLRQFGENTALFMFDESNNGFTLDPKISDIVPIENETGERVTFEITQDEFKQEYEENRQTMEEIGEKLEQEGEGEMSDEQTSGVTSEINDATVEEAAKKIKNENLVFTFQDEDTPFIDVLRGDSVFQKNSVLSDLGFSTQAAAKETQGQEKFINELSARIVKAYDALPDSDGGSTEEPSPDISQDAYGKLRSFISDTLSKNLSSDLIDPDTEKPDKTFKSMNKFGKLEIMKSKQFVLFLAQQLKKLKSELNEEENNESKKGVKAVYQAIVDNPADVKFINDNTSDKINIEKMFKNKFGVDIGSFRDTSRKDLQSIVADIKQKYQDKMGSLEGIKPFVADLAKNSKGEDGKIDPEKLRAAADEALSNLTPPEEDPVDDAPDEETTEASGLDDLLQLDGQEFIDALIQFYRDNELIDKEGVKSGLTTIRSAFKDLPVEAEVSLDDPGDLDTTGEPPAEPPDETPSTGPERLPEVYIIDEAEETNPVGQAIATITSDSVLPDNIIPFERVPDLRDKLKAVLKVKDEEVKSTEAISLTTEDLAAAMAAENGKDLMRAFLDVVKQKFGGEIPEELLKSIKLVLRKEPKAIVNMIDSPLLKMDVLEGEELAKKIAKFYPPEEDFSDNPMMANLDADERKILKFINTVFQNREVSVETSGGKELSFSGKDMKKRYLDSLKAVRSLNKDILPAIVITLNQEATGSVLEEEEELQEFFSSKKSDQTMSLVNTVEDVMGRSNPKFIGNYRNLKKAFSGSAFRKFYGDLKKLVNAFMNSELIKIDGEEFQEDDFEEDTSQSDDLGSVPGTEEIVDNDDKLNNDEKTEIKQELSKSESWYKSLPDDQQQAVATFTYQMANKGVELAPISDDEMSDEPPMTEEMTDDDLERIKPFASAAKNTFPSDFSSAMKEVMNEVDDGTKELVLTVMIDEQDNFVEYLTTMFKVQTKMGKIKDILKSWGAKIVDAIPDSVKTKIKDLKNKFPELMDALKTSGKEELGYFKSWMLSLLNTSKDVASSTMDDIKNLPDSEFVKFLKESGNRFTEDQLLKLRVSYMMAKEPVKDWLDKLVAVSVMKSFDIIDQALESIEAIKDLVKTKTKGIKDFKAPNIKSLALIALLKFGNPEVSGKEEISGYRSQADDLPSLELPTAEPTSSDNQGSDDESGEPITADDFNEGGRFREYFESFERQFEQKSNKNTRIFNIFLSRALERLSKSTPLQEVDEPSNEIELETRVDKVANKFNFEMTKAGLEDEARVVKQLIKNSRTDNKFNEVIMKIYNFDKEVASDPFRVNGKKVGLIEALADVIIKIVKKEKPKKASDPDAPRKKSTYAGDDNYDNNLDMLDNKMEEALKPMIKRVMMEMRAAK